MPALAKLDLEPPALRGPDVVYRVEVPAAWLQQGAAIECELPRKLPCARCEGAGCDTCGRSGAARVCEPGQPPRRVVVHLGSGTAEPRAIRLPQEGGLSLDRTLPRGCLVLRLDPGSPHPGVRRLEAGLASGGAVRLCVLAALVIALLVALAAWLWF